MIQLIPRSIDDTLISVTDTATLLYTLVDTASSSSNSQIYYGNEVTNGKGVANCVSIRPQDGDIRVSIGATPTATKGFLIHSGTRYFYNGEISKLKLIRVSGATTVAVEVDFFLVERGESISANTDWGGAASGGSSSTSTLTGMPNTIPEAIYRTAAITKVDGQVSPIESDSAGNEKITHATWERGADMSFDLIKVQQRATKPAAPLTASALVFTGAGQLMGWVVNSCATGATLKIWDNTSAATTVAFDTMTYTAAVNQGPSVVPLKDVAFTTGCYFTISGTMSVTPLFNQL